VAGTAYPRGSSRLPVDNIADALTIAQERDLTKLHIYGMVTVPSGTTVTGYTLEGDHGYVSLLTFVDGCVTEKC
jgi:hypothetical protein